MTDKPPIQLPDFTPKPVSLMSKPSDYFLCSPYRTTLRAQSCADRQAMVAVNLKLNEFSKCISCPLGQVVVKNTGAVGADKTEEAKHQKRTGGWGGAKSPRKPPRLIEPEPEQAAIAQTFGELELGLPPAPDSEERELVDAEVSKTELRPPALPREAVDTEPPPAIRRPLAAEHTMVHLEPESDEPIMAARMQTQRTEEQPMATTCLHPKCGKRIRRIADAPAGTEELCQEHRKLWLKENAPTDRPARKMKRTPPKEKPPAKFTMRNVPRGTAVPIVPGMVVVPTSPSADELRTAFNQLLEDHALVEKVGRDTVRLLAERIDRERAAG